MALFSFISFVLVTSLGTLYPVYLSYKAIKSNDLQSLEVLLMFWIVMGVISAAESTFGWLINWMPFYYQIKTCFMLWLTLPQIQGSTYLYVTYFHPFLLQHEHTIDQWLVEAKERSRAAGQAYLAELISRLKQLILAGLAAAHAQPDAPPPGPATQPGEPPAYLQLLRQIGPAASAIFHPMQGALPDTFLARAAPTQLSVPPARSRTASSASQTSSSRGERSGGYRIPDYEDGPLSGSTATLAASSRRNPPSADSLLSQPGVAFPIPQRTGLASSGYDEIGRDEASGSETEWLLRRPPPTGERPTATSTRRDSTPDRGRQFSGSSSSWLFRWGAKPLVEDSKKTN